MNIRRALTKIKNEGMEQYLFDRRIALDKEAVLEGRSKYSEKDLLILDITKPAAELNRALSEAREPFVAFTDPDAKYADTYFTDLLRVFSADKKVGAVCGLIRNANGEECTYEALKSGTFRYWNAAEDFSRQMLLPHGVVYRMSNIRKYGIRFPENLTFCQDAVFAASYTKYAPETIILVDRIYQCGLILDESSVKTPQSNRKEWYFDSTLPVLKALSDENGHLPETAQFTMLYLMLFRFKSNQNELIKMPFEGPAVCEAYLSEVSEVLQSVDDEILFFRHRALSWERYKKMYLASLKYHTDRLDYTIETSEDDAFLTLPGKTGSVEVCRISEQSIAVHTMKLETDESGRRGIKIMFGLGRCFLPDSYAFEFINHFENEDHVSPVFCRTELAGIVDFFDHEAARHDLFESFITLADESVFQEIRLEAVFGDCRVSKPIRFANKWQNKLNSQDPYGYWYTEGLLFTAPGDTIQIRPASVWDRDEAEKALQDHIEELKAGETEGSPRWREYRAVLNWRRAYWKTYDEFKDKRIWTYNDKGYKAGDNAEYAIRYAAAQDDGIEKVFYIDPECEDGIRLKKEGYHVLKPATQEAILYALHAEVIYMTHVPPYRKMGILDRHMPFLKNLMDAKVIRMYHGYPITRSSSYTQSAYDAVAVVVGSNYEAELYTNEDNGFTPDQILKTGNPRYDDLIDDSRKQILFAPSWRPSLVGKPLPSGATMHNPDFKKSSYYRLYEQILNDPKLIETAKEYGYRIRMFLHPIMSAQTVDFESNEVMDALSCTEDIDYVTIMRQSNLMVTDYSSVQYDFGYMRKPVVYYHDPALPYWRVTNFDYEKEGLGDICRSAAELVDVLCDYIRHDCALKPEYADRMDRFYVQKDRNSAKRLYEATLKLTE